MNISEIKEFRPITFILCKDNVINIPDGGGKYQRVLYPETTRHNSTLLKAYFAMIDANYPKLPMVFCTFSETLINVTGNLIEQRVLAADDVAVYIVDNNQDILHECTYSLDGTLKYYKTNPYKSWPYGWFMHDMDIFEDFVANYVK